MGKKKPKQPSRRPTDSTDPPKKTFCFSCYDDPRHYNRIKEYCMNTTTDFIPYAVLPYIYDSKFLSSREHVGTIKLCFDKTMKENREELSIYINRKIPRFDRSITMLMYVVEEYLENEEYPIYQKTCLEFIKNLLECGADWNVECVQMAVGIMKYMSVKDVVNHVNDLRLNEVFALPILPIFAI